MSGTKKSDRKLESYWACSTWYAKCHKQGNDEPTIGECFEAGYQQGLGWQKKRNEELEKMIADLREHTTAIYDLTGGWYG